MRFTLACVIVWIFCFFCMYAVFEYSYDLIIWAF